MHHYSEGTCKVALLRPRELELEKRLQLKAEGESDFHGDAVEKLIEQLREMLSEAAEETGIPIDIEEFQLHSEVANSRLINKKSNASIKTRNLIATINPKPKDYAYLVRTLAHPLQRGLVVFDSKESLEENACLLNAPAVPILSLHQHTILQRIHALAIPFNTELAADSYQENLRTVRTSLLYPQTETKERTDNRLHIISPKESRDLQEFLRERVRPSIRPQ